MNVTSEIEIRLIGEDLTPEKISSRDIASLIAAFEQMIASVVARDNPALAIDESDVVVGLASIRQGSYILEFATPYKPEVQSAYSIISDSIMNSDYVYLPSKSVEAIKSIRKITQKYKTDIQFWQKRDSLTPIATISGNTRIDVETPVISGKTTLYGIVIGVYGEDPPRARLRLTNGNVLSFRITRRNALEVARQLGQRLYTRVGVKGVADWDARDMSLLDFRIDEVTNYVPRPILESVADLRAIVGHYYGGVDDIDSLVAELRGDGEDYK